MKCVCDLRNAYLYKCWKKKYLMEMKWYNMFRDATPLEWKCMFVKPAFVSWKLELVLEKDSLVSSSLFCHVLFFIRVFFFFWCGVFEAQNWMIFFSSGLNHKTGNFAERWRHLGHTSSNHPKYWAAVVGKENEGQRHIYHIDQQIICICPKSKIWIPQPLRIAPS